MFVIDHALKRRQCADPYKITHANASQPAHLIFRANVSMSCPSMVFVREFYHHSKPRTEELLSAIKATMGNNSFALFRFVTAHQNAWRDLDGIRTSAGVALEVYQYYGRVTMELLFDIAREPALNACSSHIFVVSTGDVAIPPLHHLPSSCPIVFQQHRLLVASRDDVGGDNMKCERYMAGGSFDVYIGNSTMLSTAVLSLLIVSPRYWGIEAVTAYALSGGRASFVYNLCPYIRVRHHHTAGGGPSNRIFVNHPNNNVKSEGDTRTVCNVTSLVS